MREHLWYDATKVHIGGIWKDPAGGGQLPLENPSRGEEIGSIARGTAADVDEAVAAESLVEN